MVGGEAVMVAMLTVEKGKVKGWDGVAVEARL